jgi:hypothetical protein
MDSCCFIDLAEAKLSQSDSKIADNIWYSEQLLRASKAGEIQVCTSIITIAECLHADGSHDPEVRDLFLRLLGSGTGVVQHIDCELFVVERARDLRWNDDINLSGIDGIHVASGLIAQCAEFVTRDRNKGKSPIGQAKKIQHLGMKVIEPRYTDVLPEGYKQGKLIRDERNDE